jgi:hypothetical protein
MSLYKGIIAFPRVAMLGSLVWVPRGLEFWEYEAANHPSWSAFPQIPELFEVGRYPIPFCKCGALKGEEYGGVCGQ